MARPCVILYPLRHQAAARLPGAALGPYLATQPRGAEWPRAASRRAKASCNRRPSSSAELIGRDLATAQDLVDIIKSQLNRDVDKRLVTVPKIREVGDYVAEMKLHPDVTARVRLNAYEK